MSFSTNDGNHVESVHLDRKVPRDLTLFLTNPLLVFNETVTYRNAEHIPLRSSHTLASVTEYKKARNLIDLQIDRRLKIVIAFKITFFKHKRNEQTLNRDV